MNGTAVAVDHPRLLSNGDAIRIADHLLLFHHAGAQLATSAAAIEIDRAEVTRQVDDLLRQLQEPSPPQS